MIGNYFGDGFRVPTATAQSGNYDAAGQGRRLRIWRPPSSGPNTAVARDLPVIRARMRAAVRNDPWAGTALEKLDANGIATGIKAKMVNGDDEVKTAVTRRFESWCKVSDADGVLDFHAQQYLAWREWNEVGEVFVRLRPRRLEDGLPVPLQLQLIEAEQCPNDLWREEPNGNQIKAGIEVDRIGRRAAYWFYRSHPGDVDGFTVGGHELVRVPATSVRHLYRPQRAGQLRGIPDQVSVLVRMFNLENLDDAVLERNKLANLFTMFYTQSIDPERPDAIVDDLAGEEGSRETDADDVPLVGLEPGTTIELPPGMKPEFSTPPAPGEEYAAFLRGHLMAVAARHGVPYEVLTGDLRDVSDRALKLLLNEFRRYVEMKQWLFFIPQLLQPIREAWFDQAFLSNAVALPEYASRREEYVETLWVPQGWPYSHPVQDVTADIKAIAAGLDSRTAAILRAGDDPESVDRQIAGDNARAQRLGLNFDTKTPTAKSVERDVDD
jgi:lambda family phage portal protein